MKVHICGPGTVGSATGVLFRRFGHMVVFSDKGDDHGFIRADFHFVCTPEQAVEEVVESMATAPSHEAVIIRSSVSPGTTEKLRRQFRRGLLHNPEFLREATAEADIMENPYAILGSASTHSDEFNEVKRLYEDCGKQVLVCSTTESELLKLADNALLATLISYWNSIHLVAASFGINSHHLARLATINDPRISHYGALRHGLAYGGNCLEKDLKQLLDVVEEAIEAGRIPTGGGGLLQAVERINAVMHAESIQTRAGKFIARR